LSGNRPFDLDEFTLTDAQVGERLASTPRKIQKRQRHFIKVPWPWVERLRGATGQTYRVALSLLYLHWKGKGEPVKLANGMLLIDGVSRQSKWRALRDLQRRDLITVECRPNRSPIIRLLT
jgi:hypothetical protein